MTDTITITCAHCGHATGFDDATDGLPMDCFRCTGCGKVWKRCHGTPVRGFSGMILPGSITIKEVQPRTVQRQCVGEINIREQ